MLTAPQSGDEWVGLSEGPLPVAAALDWVGSPAWGASVCFTGTVRDHSEARSGVEWLAYEAYAEHAEARLVAVAAEARAQWPVGRIVLLHRVGRLHVTDAAVVVVVSAPHRAEAFAAARFAIDRLKETVPIWKKESWAGGEDWGTGAQSLAGVEQ